MRGAQHDAVERDEQTRRRATDTVRAAAIAGEVPAHAAVAHSASASVTSSGFASGTYGSGDTSPGDSTLTAKNQTPTSAAIGVPAPTA